MRWSWLDISDRFTLKNELAELSWFGDLASHARVIPQCVTSEWKERDQTREETIEMKRWIIENGKMRAQRCIVFFFSLLEFSIKKEVGGWGTSAEQTKSRPLSCAQFLLLLLLLLPFLSFQFSPFFIDCNDAPIHQRRGLSKWLNTTTNHEPRRWCVRGEQQFQSNHQRANYHCVTRQTKVGMYSTTTKTTTRRKRSAGSWFRLGAKASWMLNCWSIILWVAAVADAPSG